MKVAIFSDSHDNLPNLRKALDWIKKEKIKLILHCGDLASIETLKEILNNFGGKFYLTMGNMDKDFNLKDSLEFKDISKKFRLSESFHEIEIDRRKIAFCHFPDLAKKLAKTQKYDLVFYGHTHKPWKEKLGKTLVLNPGNLAGLYFRPTFAIYQSEKNKVELKLLENL